MSDLRVTEERSGSDVTFHLEGKIDEFSDYSQMSFGEVDRAILDFDGVTLINSSGIQRWIAFLESVPESIRVDFKNCPLRIVNQMNLFPAFLAGRDVKVHSFYAPYYCECIDESKNVLLNTDEHFADLDDIKVPNISCDQCGELMEFDGIEKKYFLFLKRKSA